MALYPIVDSLDELSDSDKKHYNMNSTTGKYHLDVPPMTIQIKNENGVLVNAQFALEDVAGIRSALDKTREENRTHKQSLQDKGDISKSDLDALRKKAADSKGHKLSESEIDKQVDSRTESLVAQHQEQLDKLTNSNTALTDQLIGIQGNQTITSEIAKHEMSTKFSSRHLLNALQPHYKVEKDDSGKYQTYIVNPVTGERRYSPNATGAALQFMSPEELLSEARDVPEFAMFFKPNANGSGGAGDPKGKDENGDSLDHLQDPKFYDANGSEVRGEPISDRQSLANLGHALNNPE